MEEKARDTLVTLLAARTTESPGAPAVLDDTGGRLTYAELDARSNEVAGRLVQRGARRGTVVGLSVSRTVDLVVGLVAILKTGAAYGPLDPTYPAARLAAMVEDAAITLVLHDAATVPPQGLVPVPIVPTASDTDSGPLEPAAARELVAPVVTEPDDLAYVVFTSGTTGRPKGVQVEHGNVAALLRACEEHYDVGTGDVWSALHSYAFDFSVWEIWGALCSGGAVLVLGEHTIRSPDRFWQACLDHGVTVLSQTPTFFAELAPVVVRAGRGTGALRHVTFGGERLSARHLGAWAGRFGVDRPRLVNMYGISETTVHVTAHVVTSDDLAGDAIPIGRPLRHLEVVLCDGAGREVAPGEVGEIVVTGAGVARGYLRPPDPDPFRPRADRAGRCYRSGDFAALDADGALRFEGRRDSQVKIRGFRVELGDTESALLSLPGVEQCAVLVEGGPTDVPSIVAYVVGFGSWATTPEELARLSAGLLPPYLRPQRIHVLDRLPRTSTGKLDTEALHAGSAPDGPGATEPVADTGQALLRREWWSVLASAPGDEEADFFSLGGDSIRVMRLVAALGPEGVPVTIEDVYREGTLAGLLRIVNERGRTGAGEEAASAARRPGDPVPPFAQVDREDSPRLPAGLDDAYPATVLQAGMLYEEMLDPELPYHNVTLARVHHRFDEERTRRTLAELIDRHPVLRTSFDLTGYSVPLQLVHRSVSPPLTVLDARHLPPDQRELTVSGVFEAESRRGFDHRLAPVFRVHVVIVDDDEFVLLTAEHHAILDGWSSALLLRDLVAESTGVLPPASVGDSRPAFASYVADESARLADESVADRWRSTLGGVTTPRLRPLVAPTESGVETMSAPLPPGTGERLAEAAAACGVPTATYLLGLHSAVYRAHTGAGPDDVVVGVVRHLRPPVPQSDLTLGLFLNSVPLVVAGGDDLAAAAVAADAAERAAFAGRGFPLGAMRSLVPSFKLDNLFNLTDFHVLEPLLETGVLRHDELEFSVTTTVPLLVEIGTDPVTRALELWVQMRRDHFTPDERRSWFDSYLAALSAERPEEFRPGPAPRPAAPLDPRSMTERLHFWAERHPDRPLVVHPTRTMTYGETWRRATAVADRLSGGAPTPVGLLLDATYDAVVAMFACLLSGRPFVPLGLDDPTLRQLSVLDLSGADTLLVSPGQADASVPLGAGRSVVELSDVPPDPLVRRPEPVSAGTDAYVLFTSGSTGAPKGVRVDQQNLAAISEAVLDRLGLVPEDRVLTWTPTTFDISLVELLMAPTAGCALVTADRDELRDPARVLDLLAGQQVTVVQSTPSRLEVLHQAGWTGARVVLGGGEVFPADLAHALRSAGSRVFNGYGPTEATIYTTIHRVGADDVDEVPIGAPLAGVELRVVPVDGTAGAADSGEPAPAELWIGGHGVARGYCGPDSTGGGRFVVEGGRRWYRSGDRVEPTPTGAYLFRGRVDSQVKVHGVRVELGELCHHLRGVSGVRAAEVVAAGHEPHRRLVAFVSLAPPGPQAAPSTSDLRAHLATLVPPAVLPEVVVLDELPLNRSGKVDASALAALAGGGDGAAEQGSAGSALAAARAEVGSPEESLVAEAWVSTLSRSAPRDVNFFEAGGNSLSVMRLAALLHRRGATLSVRDLLERQTIAEQAALLRDRRSST